MYFEVLDNKIECYGFYYDGQIHNKLPEDCRYTWSYSSHLVDKQVAFASLYVGGKDINQVCPPELKESWDIASAKLKAFLRSFLISKVNIRNDNKKNKNKKNKNKKNKNKKNKNKKNE